jgi:predicted transposase YbfD/YdcC
MEDHRIKRRKEHLLTDIIVITMSAVICGAEKWNQIELFGKSEQEWFKRFLKLPNGIPSRGTFNRFFTFLDPVKFENIFSEGVESVSKKITNEVVSIDGKTIRRSKAGGNKSPIHMVSAWVSSNNLVLGQLKVNEKSNEITAIPELLDAILIQDCIITIDAMGCQIDIAKKK